MVIEKGGEKGGEEMRLEDGRMEKEIGSGSLPTVFSDPVVVSHNIHFQC